MTDLHLAIRYLLKHRGFSAIAVSTLALGIGANTAVFSVLNAVMFLALPYPASDRLIRVHRTSQQSQSWPHSVANYLDHRSQNQSFEHLAAFSWRGYNLTEPGRPAETLSGIAATADLFAVLGMNPSLGRIFTSDEDQPGRDGVVVLSHGFWLNRFAGDTNIIGRQLRMDGESVTVIGVMPPDFECPLLWGRVNVWRPIAFSNEQRQSRGSNWLQAVGRLRTGVTRAAAVSEMNALASRLAKEHPEENTGEGLRLISLHDSTQDDTGRRVSWMTMGLTGFVLLIACANLANLQLARGTERLRDCAIRAAMGARRGRLMSQLLTESLVLSAVGGALGLLLAAGLNQLLARRILIDGQSGLVIGLDPGVLGFAVLVSVATGIVFGTVPAWLTAWANIVDALKQGRGGRGATAGRSHHRLRHAFAVAEIALSLALLSGAGLFLRGLDRFTHRDPGWQLDGLLSGFIALPSTKYSGPSQQNAFVEEMLRRLSQLAGVERSALSWSLPVWGFSTSSSFMVEGRPEAPRGQQPLAYEEGVTPGYFETLGIRVIRGRVFTPADTTNAPAVAIINEAMARRFWPGENPIGKRIGNVDAKDRDWRQIVGVVSDVRFPGNLAPPDTGFQIYRPLAQSPRSFLTSMVRCSLPPGTLMDSVRRVVAEIDSDQPIQELRSVRQTVDRALNNFSLVGALLGGFAVLGLLLAALGIYGVVTGFVSQRTNEIGVRVTLGAERKDVLQMVLNRGFRLTLWGLAIGLFGAFLLSRVLLAVAPELPSQDPIAITLVTILLAAAAMFASWLPARRATRIDPIAALHGE